MPNKRERKVSDLIEKALDQIDKRLDADDCGPADIKLALQLFKDFGITLETGMVSDIPESERIGNKLPDFKVYSDEEVA